MIICAIIVFVVFFLFVWPTYKRKKCTVMPFSSALSFAKMSVLASVISNEKHGIGQKSLLVELVEKQLFFHTSMHKIIAISENKNMLNCFQRCTKFLFHQEVH